MERMPRWADVILTPLISLALAFAISALVILAIGESPTEALKVMVEGALGSSYGWGFTLYYATNFIFTALAVAVASHAGLFNIGAEGQATLGGLGVALVALANGMLEPLTGLTLQRIAGWLFWPLAWAMGVPAAECATVGRLLGIKVVVNEFVSYLELASSGGAALSERSRLVLTYALCGFTNFGSVGIMVTGMAAMCPERRAEIVSLGLPSLVAASIACCMAGATVGLLTPP